MINVLFYGIFNVLTYKCFVNQTFIMDEIINLRLWQCTLRDPLYQVNTNYSVIRIDFEYSNIATHDIYMVIVFYYMCRLLYLILQIVVWRTDQNFTFRNVVLMRIENFYAIASIFHSTVCMLYELLKLSNIVNINCRSLW